MSVPCLTAEFEMNTPLSTFKHFLQTLLIHLDLRSFSSLNYSLYYTLSDLFDIFLLCPAVERSWILETLDTGNGDTSPSHTLQEDLKETRWAISSCSGASCVTWNWLILLQTLQINDQNPKRIQGCVWISPITRGKKNLQCFTVNIK